MIEVAFARHGKTQWNMDKRFQGLNDQPIHPETQKQFSDLILPQKYQNYQIFSSPLKRAQQTLQAMNIENYEVIECLHECDFGEWEGKTYEEAQKNYPHGFEGYDGLDYKHHKGESYREVQERVLPFLKSIKENSFIMAHKALIMAIYSAASGWNMLERPEHRLDYAKIHSFYMDEGKLLVGDLNQDFLKRGQL